MFLLIPAHPGSTRQRAVKRSCVCVCVCVCVCIVHTLTLKGKSSSYSITERRVPELIPVLGSQPADDMSNKPRHRLPLLSA